MRAEVALERLGGIADRRALLRPCSRRALETATVDGAIVRIGRSRYAVPAAHEAKLVAARAGGVVSHLSAALAHGWKVKAPPAAPHVTVRRTRSRVRVDGAVVHWGELTDEALAAGVTDPVRTVVECARTLPFDEALAVADSALRSRAVSHQALLEAALSSPRTGRATAVRVARAADRRAANPFESVLRAIALEVPGLRPVPQGPVGAIGHADLTDQALQIAIEAESFEFHAQAEAFRYNVRRYTAMTRLGWLVARFVWGDVMHRPAYVAEALTDLVHMPGRGGPTRGAGRPNSTAVAREGLWP